MSEKIINAMSVDVEEYFQVSAFEKTVDRNNWNSIESRVCSSIDTILELFDIHGVKSTFFVLGCIAERHPQLIKKISKEGHEIASHGWQHVKVINQSPEEFKQDITATKKILEDISGQKVNGYRAASFSINDKNLWALDVLQESGYIYSSSIYPIKHDTYGMPNAPRVPFRINEGSILEIPISTLQLNNRNLPCGGGGYFRLLPYLYSKWSIQRLNEKDGVPAIFYFHPWELDPDQPRQTNLGLKTKFRHYTNLKHMQKKLDKLFVEFKWGRIDHVYNVS